MIETRVDPVRLVRVRHALDGKEYRVTRSVWLEPDREFLNTYTRGAATSRSSVDAQDPFVGNI